MGRVSGVGLINCVGRVQLSFPGGKQIVSEKSDVRSL